jgi:deoxyribonuclease-4
LRFGVHVSIAKSLDFAVDRAKRKGCTTFQIFTRNPRSWQFKELKKEVCSRFIRKTSKTNIKPVFSHTPYLTNLASPDDEIWNKSIKSLKVEIERCSALKIPFICTHLGSPKSYSNEFGIKRTIKALELIFENDAKEIKILLENTTGKTRTFGNYLEDIFRIILSSKYTNRLGLCFDTCHAFASGYDLRSKNTVNELVEGIENTIGIEKLGLIHCNDSKFDLGEGRDRHEHIGLGKIGDSGFKNLLNNEKLKKTPFICETPIDKRRDDKGNLEHLKSLIE